MREWIEATVELMRSNRNASANEILRLLITCDIPEPDAMQLVTLVPIAYGRVLLRDCGAAFSANYVCPGSELKSTSEHPLSSLPLWNEITNFAKSELAARLPHDSLITIAGRSSELHAINHALHAGKKLQNLVLTPPHFHWPVFAQSNPPPGRATKRRSWWKF